MFEIYVDKLFWILWGCLIKFCNWRIIVFRILVFLFLLLDILISVFLIYFVCFNLFLNLEIKLGIWFVNL